MTAIANDNADLIYLTDDELEAEVTRAYGSYMYHESAERGYDYEAASKCANRYYACLVEVKRRKV
jgi:ribosomal protein S11